MARNYWLDLFSIDTWRELQEHDSKVSGFSEGRLTTVKRMRPGDYLLCYLTRASRWVGVLEVTGEAYSDDSRIWSSQVFPSRVPVKPLIILEPEVGVPVLDMRDELSVFQGLSNPNFWSGPFRGSPAKWKAADGEAVVRALREAEESPIHRPLRGPKKEASTGDQVLPVDDELIVVPADDELPTDSVGAEGTQHTEIQYLIMKLGADMGFDVHLANNDASRLWRGQRLGDLPRRIERLPQQFDPVTNKTIELIDVLWLQGNAIIAAFEIESTTSIYSGLLRMSDLLAMQPNLSIPLFLVAPEDRRSKVIQQVNRPTFERMKPPLVEVCRYIAFETLRDALQSASPFVRYLKADWLQTLSESCALDDA